MGLIRNIKNRKDDKQKGKITKAKIIAMTIFKLIKSSWLVVVIVAVSAVSWVLSQIFAEETPKKIYESIDIENVTELVEIKGNESDGYHLEFVDNIDEKLDALINSLNEEQNYFVMSKDDKDILKDMFKAEIVTQFPDLGGKFDEENENQFQGAIDIRRITPNKDIGEMKNTGAGEKVTLDDLKENEKEEENEDINYEIGEALHIKGNVGLYLKGEYELTGEKISDEGVTSKSLILLENVDGVDNTRFVKIGQVVYYKGDSFSDGKNTYVEISKEPNGESMGYIKSIYIESQTNNTGTQVEEDDDDIDKSKPSIGDENKKYKIAIAAGYNNSDDKGKNYNDEFVSEDMTIKVAEKVEELFEQYGNVTVIQTGSTSDNRSDVSSSDRVDLANGANPDLCVQIYFNDEEDDNSSGVEVNYEFGDGLSQQLAEIMSKKISESLGIENKGIVSEPGVSDYYDAIDSSYNTGFPSVITRGGNINNEEDRNKLSGEGLNNYAKAIVEGCIEYIESSHDEYDNVENITKNDTYSRTNSHIYDLTYVPQDTFESYVNNADTKALDVYTLDDNFNLITATWSVDDSSITIRKNSSMNFRNTLQDITMPYEYLLFYLITSLDDRSEDFVQAFAEMVQDTEIVMAIQDNVTSTKVNTDIYQCTKILSDEGDQGFENFGSDWHKVSEEKIFTENASTSVAITYADTWFMEYEKGSGYNAESLGVDKGTKVDIVKNVKGTVNDQTSQTKEAGENDEGYAISDVKTQTYKQFASVETPAGHDQAELVYNTYECSYQSYEKKYISTHTISNTYEDEESVVSGNTSKFVELFKKYDMKGYFSDTRIYNMIKDNERTANLLDLTKYMIYKATNIDYGVTDFDFSVYDLSAFESMSGLYGNTIQEKIWWALIDSGYSKIAAAAVLGNLHVESGGFDASAVEEGSGEGIGLVQWSFGRRTALESYAASKGVSWQDENTQIEFLIAELNPGGGANGFATFEMSGSSSTGYDGRAYTYSDWKDTEDLTVSTKAFMALYERPNESPSINHIDQRIQWAQTYYDQFKDLEKPTGGATSLTQAADKVARYLFDNNYTYRNTGSANYTFPIANNGLRTLSCSSFIQECLVQAGYSQAVGAEKLWARTNSSLSINDFKSMGINVELITDMNALQPGDIVQYTTGYHVVMVYSVSGSNVQVKGVPEVMNPAVEPMANGYDGAMRTVSFLQSKGCYALRITN